MCSGMANHHQFACQRLNLCYCFLSNDWKEILSETLPEFALSKNLQQTEIISLLSTFDTLNPLQVCTTVVFLWVRGGHKMSQAWSAIRNSGEPHHSVPLNHCKHTKPSPAIRQGGLLYAVLKASTALWSVEIRLVCRPVLFPDTCHGRNKNHRLNGTPVECSALSLHSPHLLFETFQRTKLLLC